MKHLKLGKRFTAALVCAVLASSVLVQAAAVSTEVEPTRAESNFLTEFQTPSLESRPTIRWWVPETADETQVRAEIQDFAAAGYGRIEVIPFYAGGYFSGMFGGTAKPGYEWDSPFWLNLMKAMVEQAIESGIMLDMDLSPAWNISSPLIQGPDDPAAEVRIAVGKTDLETGAAFTGNVPVDVADNKIVGTPRLLSVSLAQKAADGASYDPGSIIDITSQAVQDPESPTGYSIQVQVPTEGNWTLFGNWEMPTGGKKSNYYMIDHYGQAGADSIISYWENTLIPAIGEENFRKAVNSVFCDSLEMSGNWSRQFIETFFEVKGYDISPYLFLLPGSYPTSDKIYNSTYRLSDAGLSEAILRDYFDVLTECFNRYHLDPIRNFCHRYGMTLRYQTAYGKTLEMASTAMNVDIPETEAMGRRNTIDSFRAQAGAVNTAGREEYGIELQASTDQKNYAQDWDDLLFVMQRAWAAGVNTQTIHGASYRGDFTDSENGYCMDGITWPGYEGFMRAGFLPFSNNWQRLPSWKHINDYTDYMGRTNYTLQQGKADVDIAVYRNEYMDDIKPADSEVYPDGQYLYKDGGELERLGYTYDFVAPANLMLETSVVKDGVLCPDGPSYKAMVIQNQTYMSGNTAKRILQYAQSGLPVVIIGDTPTVSGAKNEDPAATVEAMRALLKLPSVRQVNSYQEVPAALEELSVEPDALFVQREEVLTQHRATDDADFYYVYNFGRTNNSSQKEEYRDAIKPVSFDVAFEGEGIPYLLDAWTGEITPLANYTVRNGRIQLHLDLDSNESVLLAFASPEWGGVDVDSSVTAVTKGEAVYTQDGGLALRSNEAGISRITLSTGETQEIALPSVQDPLTLSSWDLTVQDYGKGEREIDTVVTEIAVGETALKPWNEIAGLEHAAGIGRYTTVFTLEKGWEQGVGAILDLGRVQDSFQVEINGHKLQGCNRYTSRVDLGRYLKAGENTLTVEVGTTLVNKLAEIYPSENHTVQDYGLLGTNGAVLLTPYSQTELSAGISLDTSILQKVIAYAEQVRQTDEFTNVIESVQKSFDQALENAKQLLNQPASQPEIDAAWKTLMTEIHKLGFIRGDKTTLGELIDLADTFDAQIDNYTPITAEPFAAALVSAKAVLADGNAIQDDVSQAESALLDAMMQLRLKADKSILASLLAKAAGIDTTAYTAESTAVFNEANGVANAVNDNVNAAQEEVDSAASSLNRAIDGLTADKITSAATEIEGDTNLTTRSESAKTGETSPISAALSLLVLAGAGFVLCRKNRTS